MVSGFSPEHRTLAVVSIGSNSVTFIDTATNTVKGVVYIGRSPHEAFFTPDGKELWATVRGENYVSVIDPVQMKEIRRVQTANGPGMVLFRPGRQVCIRPFQLHAGVGCRRHADLRGGRSRSAGKPVLAQSGGEPRWNGSVVHAQRFRQDAGDERRSRRFSILATLDTGPITNHVTLVDNANGKFAYISVGGENVVKVYRRARSRSWLPRFPQATSRTASGDRVTAREYTLDWKIRTRSQPSIHTPTPFSRRFQSASSRRRSFTFPMRFPKATARQT